MPSLTLHVNGADHEIEAELETPLVYVLRNTLGLTGAKIGCGLEQCGSCAVLVDEVSTLSCVSPVSSFVGRKIVTAEGLDADAIGLEVRQAFIEEGAAQCGYCTPGIVIAVTALLRRSRSPGAAEIRDALEPHLCRCGAHARVLAAVRRLTAREAPDDL